MNKLIERLERATGPDRELDGDIAIAIGKLGKLATVVTANDESDVFSINYAAAYTSSIDAALKLLPGSACNHDLYSFGGHGRGDIGSTAWGFNFHDMAQLVGKARAKKRIARMRKDSALMGKLRGPPVEMMEQAIAEQFMEFTGTHAATPAIALCIAALKARAASVPGPFG